MLNAVSRVISVLMHPFLVGIYALLLCIALNTYAFGSPDIATQLPLIAQFAYITVFLPILGIIVLRYTGIVHSFSMQNRMERIGPLMLASLFYCWVFINFNAAGNLPVAAKILALGAVIAVFAGFIANLFVKISLHSIAAGALLMFTMLTFYPALQLDSGFIKFSLFFWDNILWAQYHILAVVILLAGLTLSFRLWSGTHSSSEVWTGFFIGIAGIFFSFRYFIHY